MASSGAQPDLQPPFRIQIRPDPRRRRVVASAAVALLGGLLTNAAYSPLLKDPIWGAPIDGLALGALVCLSMTFLHVLAATSPSLTMLDTSIVPGEGLAQDSKPESLVFFSDIKEVYGKGARPNYLGYRDALRRRIERPDEMFDDLAFQIVEVAAIASKKAERVKAAAKWLYRGLLAGGGAFVVTLVAKAVSG